MSKKLDPLMNNIEENKGIVIDWNDHNQKLEDRTEPIRMISYRVISMTFNCEDRYSAKCADIPILLIKSRGAFTYECDSVSKIVISSATISPMQTPDKKSDCIALWDTGATICAITREFAEVCGLRKTQNEFKIITANGYSNNILYYGDIYLPGNIKISNVPFVEVSEKIGTDIVIGMDIISLGDFAVTNHGKTVFTFRIPPKGKIDFENQSRFSKILYFANKLFRK